MSTTPLWPTIRSSVFRRVERMVVCQGRDSNETINRLPFDYELTAITADSTFLGEAHPVRYIAATMRVPTYSLRLNVTKTSCLTGDTSTTYKMFSSSSLFQH